MAADDARARGFREVDHSGDVGIDVWGATLADLLANATRGLCTLMTWNTVARSCSRSIEVEAASPQDLVVDWLSAVILASATHAELYAAAEVVVAEDVVARGVVFGEPINAVRHALRFDVKAATYHGMQMEKTASGYRARVIFDL
jgi:SHS2 domain-containing protein